MLFGWIRTGDQKRVETDFLREECLAGTVLSSTHSDNAVVAGRVVVLRPLDDLFQDLVACCPIDRHIGFGIAAWITDTLVIEDTGWPRIRLTTSSAPSHCRS